jgi:formyl-CoA transferase
VTREQRLPLEDVRVLDLTSARSGPMCVRQLTDWGADAIRIEPPQPNATQIGLRDGSDFQNLHRNKRSLTLDLKTERGRQLLLELVERSDVVVENMRPQVKHRLGIDYETLRSVNPRIVYGSISGFGQDGPGSARGGADQIAQGASGLMSVTGFAEGPPVRCGAAITDVTAGLLLALAIMIAIHDRERTGQGAWVTTSLLEAGVTLLDFQAARWTMEGDVAGREGNHHPTAIPMGCFPTADGHINIAAWDGRLFRDFCRIIGVPALPEDERFCDAQARLRNREALHEVIGERLEAAPTRAWIEAFDEAGIPAGPVYSIDDAFADPQAQHLALSADVRHPTLGTISILRSGFSVGDYPSGLRSAAPEAGEHSHEILADLGLASDEIDELRAQGVV